MQTQRAVQLSLIACLTMVLTACQASAPTQTLAASASHVSIRGLNHSVILKFPSGAEFEMGIDYPIADLTQELAPSTWVSTNDYECGSALSGDSGGGYSVAGLVFEADHNTAVLRRVQMNSRIEATAFGQHRLRGISLQQLEPAARAAMPIAHFDVWPRPEGRVLAVNLREYDQGWRFEFDRFGNLQSVEFWLPC